MIKSKDSEKARKAERIKKAVHISCQHAHFIQSASSPGSNVIVLSTPAPVLIGETIHLHVLVWGHC